MHRRRHLVATTLLVGLVCGGCGRADDATTASAERPLRAPARERYLAWAGTPSMLVAFDDPFEDPERYGVRVDLDSGTHADLDRPPLPAATPVFFADSAAATEDRAYVAGPLCEIEPTDEYEPDPCHALGMFGVDEAGAWSTVQVPSGFQHVGTMTTGADGSLYVTLLGDQTTTVTRLDGDALTAIGTVTGRANGFCVDEDSAWTLSVISEMKQASDAGIDPSTATVHRVDLASGRAVAVPLPDDHLANGLGSVGLGCTGAGPVVVRTTGTTAMKVEAERFDGDRWRALPLPSAKGANALGEVLTWGSGAVAITSRFEGDTKHIEATVLGETARRLPGNLVGGGVVLLGAAGAAVVVGNDDGAVTPLDVA